VEDQKVILVRSPAKLLHRHQVGHGWPQVNFSNATDVADLMNAFAEQEIDLGRRRNQVKRFFSIKEGDIVVVPLYKAVAIGFATGARSYETGIKNAENRLEVKFLCHEHDGTIVRAPRDDLSGALSSRLKVRIAVASLNEFKQEIHEKIDQIKTTGGTNFSSQIKAQEEAAAARLQDQLLKNIRDGNTRLESGGRGLEKLITELLCIEGYDAKVLHTRSFEGAADADIEAIRSDHLSSSRLLIQVKHHAGNTGLHGLRQLQQLETDEDVQKWLITTGGLSQKLIDEAESYDINVMDGEGFSEWLVKCANQLSEDTLRRLGIEVDPISWTA